MLGSRAKDVLTFINTDDEFRAATERLMRLYRDEDAPLSGSVEAQRRAALSAILAEYEAPTRARVLAMMHEGDDDDAVDAIEHAMERMELTRKDLEPFIGTRGRVSEVLTRKRGLSLAMVRSLHAGLHIPLEQLLREPKKPARKRSRAKVVRTARKGYRALVRDPKPSPPPKPKAPSPDPRARSSEPIVPPTKRSRHAVR
ncbi:MAG: hypothetical protein Q8Q09_14365 [Deltaproteobacteria bacterium]|nr:hypothetical protein [Deltaproteobacteria bacterium]